MAAKKALATRENQGNLAPAKNGGRFLSGCGQRGIKGARAHSPSFRRESNIRYNRRGEAEMIKLKVTTVGSSAGIVLPREALARLKVAKGDSVFFTESPDGFRITPYDPEFEEDMALARQVMRKRRDLLRELAK
jgi:putative addiction module antidote